MPNKFASAAPTGPQPIMQMSNCGAAAAAAGVKDEDSGLANKGAAGIWAPDRIQDLFNPIFLASSAWKSAMGRKPGAVRQKASDFALILSAGCATSRSSMQGWSIYQAVSKKTSSLLPSGSRK